MSLVKFTDRACDDVCFRLWPVGGICLRPSLVIASGLRDQL
jgi:hypothetical protein